MSATINILAARLPQPDALACLSNEARRYTRRQTTGRGYQRQKAKQREAYAALKAKREPAPTKREISPWNDMDCEMRLFMCASVREILNLPMKRTRKEAKERELTGHEAAAPGIRAGQPGWENA